MGNATKFAITEGGEIKERKSRMRDTYGQVLDSVPVKEAAKIAVTVDDLKVENLALALLGDTSDISVSAGSVTDEAMTARHDKYVALAHRDISSVVVTDSGGSTTYVANTDYVVHQRLGMIKALSTGSITDGQSLLVDYSYGALSGTKIEGSARPIIKGALKLDGENQVTEKDCIVDVWEAVLQPAAEVDFLAEEFNSLELEGTLNTPTGRSDPYEVQYMS